MSKKNKKKNVNTVNNNVKTAPVAEGKKDAVEAATQVAETNEEKPTGQIPDIPTPKENPSESAPVPTANKAEQNEFASILGVMKQTSGSGLSADGYVRLAGIMDDKYRKDSAAAQKYSPMFLNGASRIVDTIVFGTLLEQVVNTTTPISLLIRKSSFPELQNLASTFGVKLPDADKLRLPTPEDLVKAGISQSTGEEGVLDFKPEDIPEDVTKKIQDDKKKADAEVEMDPKKITTKDQLVAALNKIFAKRNSRSVENNILTAIKFIKDYRYAELERDGNSSEKRAVLDSRNIDDWIQDAISITEPTLMFRQIGSNLAKYCVEDESPVGAFLSMRCALKFRGECALSDEEVAEIVKFIVLWYNTYVTAENTDKLKGKLTKSAKEVLQTELDTANKAVHYLTHFDKAIPEKVVDAYKPGTPGSIKKLYFFTRSEYFAKEIAGTKTSIIEESFVNLMYNVQQKVGVIGNLFLPQSDKVEKYSDANIKPLEKSEAAKEAESGESAKEASNSGTSNAEDVAKK